MVEPITTTEPLVSVMLLVRSKCPGCGEVIEQQAKLDEHSLSTGNTTQQASYWAKQMKAEVEGKMKRRGWTPEMCGRCRDQA